MGRAMSEEGLFSLMKWRLKKDQETREWAMGIADGRVVLAVGTVSAKAEGSG